MGARARTPRVVAGLMAGVLAGVLVGLLVGLAGCGLVPSRPEADDWVASARQSLDDTASEVATVGLVVEQEQQDRLPASYAAVVAARSEAAAGTAADGITAQQPPDSKRQEYDAVAAALGDAADLVAEARIALVDHDTAAYRRLAERLSRMERRLAQLATSVGR